LDLKLKVLGLRFRIKGFGLWVLRLRLGFGVLDFGLRVKGSKLGFQDSGFRPSGSGFRD